MSAKTYNHHIKAGNQGDVVKHPTLIAALDAVLSRQSATTRLFHYLDLFAGHAWHPLLDGKEYEWMKGIGALSGADLPDDAPASVKSWWNMWHSAPEWPSLVWPGYPGSAWIAAHRCRNAKRPIKLQLYDHCEEVRRDLESAFRPSHDIQSDNANICLIEESLELTDGTREEILQPDFVFIDPPGWFERNPSYPKWDDVCDHILAPRGNKGGNENRPTLMWMPSSGNNGVFNGKPSRKILEVQRAQYQWSAIRWRTHGSATACILVYNFGLQEIRESIDCIVRIAGYGWQCVHSA